MIPRPWPTSLMTNVSRFCSLHSELQLVVFCSNLPWFLLLPRFFVVQFDGISWDKGCQESRPLLNTEWTRIESLSAVNAVSCQWNFTISVFQTKRWNLSLKILVNLDKREVIKYARLLTTECEGKGTFWENPSTPLQPLKAAWFISNLFVKTNFWCFPKISVIFCRSILVGNLSVRMWSSKYMQSDESLRRWLAKLNIDEAKMHVSKS